MTEFQREERYVVIKISKMHPHPTFRAKHLSALKRDHGDALVDCVVVERDWPEHEHVWSMLESRITGAPTLDHVNCHSTIRKQSELIDTLRAQLAEQDALLREAHDLINSGNLAARVESARHAASSLRDRIKAAIPASAEPVDRLRTDLDETTAVLRELVQVMYLGSPLPDWSFGESSLMTRLRDVLERNP